MLFKNRLTPRKAPDPPLNDEELNALRNMRKKLDSSGPERVTHRHNGKEFKAGGYCQAGAMYGVSLGEVTRQARRGNQRVMVVEECIQLM